MSGTFDFGDGLGPVPAHRHNNLSTALGGWVAGSASVHQYAYVSRDAQVFGLSVVGEQALILGQARVHGRAAVTGRAWVRDGAEVFGSAQILGSARISGEARVFGEARVGEDATVSGQAQVYERAEICGKARVFGQARVFGWSTLCESAVVCGSVSVCLDFVGRYRNQIAMQALLEKQADLRSGDGWTAHRLVSGLALNVHRVGEVEVFTFSSWDELPRLLLDHGLISPVEYLAMTLMGQERAP